MTVAAPQVAPVESEPPSAPDTRIEPSAVIDELALHWRDGGETALLQHWGAAQRLLNEQPLNRQVDFSAAFAQWVLATPELPDGFLKVLNQHFAWLDDFRTERWARSGCAASAWTPTHSRG